jgi:all-trans-8'-apo-beta-carotenal 15,15'-oxygenase
MQWRPQEGTTVLIIPIDAPDRYKRFKVDAFFQYHFMNAYEAGSDIVVDFIHVSDFDAAYKGHNREKHSDRMPTKGRLYRAIVKPDLETVELHQQWDEPCEFPQLAPSVQGRQHRFGYVLASRDGEPQTSIVKVDFETGKTESVELGANQFPSEAVFIPRDDANSENEGYLASLAYDGNTDRSFVAILDASRLSEGAIARAWFDHHIPRPLHATWDRGFCESPA